MPDTYSIKPQIYNISHANTNVDFVTKKDTSCDTLHIHLHPIHLKYTHIATLSVVAAIALILATSKERRGGNCQR